MTFNFHDSLCKEPNIERRGNFWSCLACGMVGGTVYGRLKEEFMGKKLYELRQGSGRKHVIKLFRDGDNMCAMFGANLQEGQAEFEPINDVKYDVEENKFDAGYKALHRLLDRLGFDAHDCDVQIDE